MSCSKFRILYIEEDVDEKRGCSYLEMLTESISNMVCVVTVVSTVFLGLECTEYTCYNLVIVKQGLRHLNAQNMVKILRNVGAPMPIVLLLDDHDPTDDASIHEAGFFAALRKPFASAALVALILRVQDQSYMGVQSQVTASVSVTSSEKTTEQDNESAEVDEPYENWLIRHSKAKKIHPSTNIRIPLFASSTSLACSTLANQFSAINDGKKTKAPPKSFALSSSKSSSSSAAASAAAAAPSNEGDLMSETFGAYSSQNRQDSSYLAPSNAKKKGKAGRAVQAAEDEWENSFFPVAAPAPAPLLHSARLIPAHRIRELEAQRLAQPISKPPEWENKIFSDIFNSFLTNDNATLDTSYSSAVSNLLDNIASPAIRTSNLPRAPAKRGRKPKIPPTQDPKPAPSASASAHAPASKRKRGQSDSEESD